MNKYNSVLGLGVDNYSDEPWLGSGSSSTGSSSSGFFDKAKNTLSDLFDLTKQGTDIYKDVKSGGSSGGGTVILPGAPPQNNTMKLVLIGGGLALAATAVVLLMKGKKKKALGEVGVVRKKGQKRTK